MGTFASQVLPYEWKFKKNCKWCCERHTRTGLSFGFFDLQQICVHKSGKNVNASHLKLVFVFIFPSSFCFSHFSLSKLFFFLLVFFVVVRQKISICVIHLLTLLDYAVHDRKYLIISLLSSLFICSFFCIWKKKKKCIRNCFGSW